MKIFDSIGYDGNIYIVGSITLKSDNSTKPCYWKNNELFILDTESNLASATCIAIYDNKLLIGGYEYFDEISKSVYWLNGRKFTIQDDESTRIDEVLICNNDIIFAGQELDSTDSKVFLWDNIGKKDFSKTYLNDSFEPYNEVRGILKKDGYIFFVGKQLW